MLGKTGNQLFGATLYFLGVMLVNTFFEPVKRSFAFHASIELMIFSLAVFFLSSLFYGRVAFLLMFFPGVFFGGNFTGQPLYVIFAVVPLLIALSEGSDMGNSAYLDLRGRLNFFDRTKQYSAQILAIIALSLIIGFVLGWISLDDILSRIPFEEAMQFYEDKVRV